MASNSTAPVIRLRGVRHNNLQGFDLDLPQNRLVVITGLSGSGKSSLAFDTLFAEGQRRYIETFTPYARQFFDRMDKPRVDSIEGIPPAIAIEQRNAVRTTRSTVGTMTEVGDYLKVLWPHLAVLHCRGCGRPVRRDSPQAIWQALARGEGGMAGAECLVTFDVALAERLSLDDSLALIAGQGYQRLLVHGEVCRLENLPRPVPGSANPASGSRCPTPTTTTNASLTVVQDRLRVAPANRARFVEACEQAYHFGKGKLTIWRVDAGKASAGGALKREKVEALKSGAKGVGERQGRGSDGGGGVLQFHNRLHCAECDIEYREPTPALFSFNHPVGACPKCKGFGRVIEIDYQLAIPDRGKTLAGGAVKPWQSGMSAECQEDLRKFCQVREVPMDVPFRELSAEHQRWLLEGDSDYGTDEEHQWPRAWYGVKGYFRWLESKAYKMHVRVLLSRYRTYTTCPECQGRRLKPEALLYRLRPSLSETRNPKSGIVNQSADAGNPVPALSLADFYALPVIEAHGLVEALCRERPERRRGGESACGLKSALPGPEGLRLEAGPFPGGPHGPDPVTLALEEVRARLGYLVEVGLGYLALDRATRTLSGGETERVSLTTCLGSRLVNTLFVLDEPSVGLHPRDTDRLIRILERLRDAGNTVVVVEHEASVIRAADQVVDLGPGHGETGGRIVFQGSYRDLLRSRESLTGQYLSGRRQIELPHRRRVRPRRDAVLSLAGVTRHNLHGLTVQIPLGRFVVVTGVSGSGKSTLIREMLYPALAARLEARSAAAGAGNGRSRESDEADEGGGEPESSAGEAPAASGARTPDSVSLEGWGALQQVVMVDQSPLGRTPRSNPAVYIGAFDDLRGLFAGSAAARQRELNASAFSFNSRLGQCERCRGAGFEKIEMQFLSDVFIRCPDCDGRRYRAHILECKMQNSECRNGDEGVSPGAGASSIGDPGLGQGWSIADVLEATVDEVVAWLGGFGDLRHARSAAGRLRVLQDVGLGYLRLGQPINTLSGGESQRLKLAAHLAEAGARSLRTSPETAESGPALRSPSDGLTKHGTRSMDYESQGSDHPASLFLFDEPTTGLHFDDVRVLLGVFQRLVDAGESVVVIEHNLDVVKCADWVIDLGPEAGDDGGRVVVTGTPETVAACEASHTGRALRSVGVGKTPLVTPEARR